MVDSGCDMKEQKSWEGFRTAERLHKWLENLACKTGVSILKLLVGPPKKSRTANLCSGIVGDILDRSQKSLLSLQQYNRQQGESDVVSSTTKNCFKKD